MPSNKSYKSLPLYNELNILLKYLYVKMLVAICMFHRKIKFVIIMTKNRHLNFSNE